MLSYESPIKSVQAIYLSLANILQGAIIKWHDVLIIYALRLSVLTQYCYIAADYIIFITQVMAESWRQNL